MKTSKDTLPFPSNKWIALFLFVSAVCFIGIYIKKMQSQDPSYSLIYPHETIKSLESQKDTSAQVLLSNFLAKGGTFIRLETKPFAFLEGDLIFPSCSGGNNRSQVLWHILRSYTNHITLMPPHATQYGFDPYNNLSNWKQIKHERKGDEFFLWAHASKCQKLGWDVFENLLLKTKASLDELSLMKKYYNQNYYSPDFSSDKRRIYITFEKNAHIHLYRLNQTNASLENVILLLLPINDLISKPLPEWNTFPRSEKAYREFSSIIESLFDFKNLPNA